MPYQAKQEKGYIPTVTRRVFGSSSGTSTWTGGLTHITHFSRTGTNRNSSAMKRERKKPRRVLSWVLVPTQVPRGPRLPYKVWDQKKQRYVWKRQLIWVYKRKPVYQKTKIRPPEPLIPNDLDFYDVVVSDYAAQSNEISCWSTALQKGVTYTGNLLHPFQYQYGSYQYCSGDIANFTGSISTEYSSIIADLERGALNGLYEKAKNQKVNLAVAFAERKATAEGIASLVSRAAQAMLAIKRGNLQRAARILFPGDSKELSNDWLMIQYGLKPLLSDIQGSIDAILEANDDELIVDIISAKSRDVPWAVIQTYVDTFAGKQKTTVRRRSHIAVKYKCRLRISSPGMRRLNELGLTNLLAVGWETIPYSFVADWLLPVGDYLNTMDAFTGVQVEWVTKTVFQKDYTIFERAFGGTDGYGFVWPSVTLGSQIERTKVKRTLTSVVPDLQIPEFKNPFSLGHIANAAALLRQLR